MTVNTWTRLAHHVDVSREMFHHLGRPVSIIAFCDESI